MPPFGWCLGRVVGGALPLRPAVLRPGLGRRARVTLLAAVLAADVLLAGATVWALWRSGLL